MNLSPAMVKAIEESFDDGTIQGATRRTEQGLIRRGLADERRGIAERPNRYAGRYHATTTVYDAYLGARLNAAGLELRATLMAEDGR